MIGKSKAKTPSEYISSLEEPRKSEIKELDGIIRKTTGLNPSISVGMLAYGKFHYVYASGREGDWYSVCLASQKNYISLYVCMASGKKYITESYKPKLPKASIGKSCVRFNRLADVDLKVIISMLKENHNAYKKQYGK